MPLQQYSTIEVKNKYVHCSGDGASQGLATLIPTKEQPQEASMFVACRKVFTEEEDADENGWIDVILWSFQHHCGVPSDVRAACTKSFLI